MKSSLKPLVMGVLNVTPDSFSDGGRFSTLAKALFHAEAMIFEGADVIDVGGESTRPGAATVSATDEKARTVPVISAIRNRFQTQISIDTQKAEVAEAAIGAGANIINDVSAGDDPDMARVAAKHQSTVVLMHRQGDAQTMQLNPHYPKGVVTEVKTFLAERCERFRTAGVKSENIWVDPGIGFGKTLEHNLELLAHLQEFSDLGARVLIGTSRKSFLARVVGNPDLPMPEREAGTLASHLWAYQQGASVFRVHDVGAMVRALKTWSAIELAAGKGRL